MTRRALDLFCGGGGAALGMIQAGFEVTGVDHVARHAEVYPGYFIHADVLEIPRDFVAQFDLVWASPPCQAFSVGTPPHLRDAHPDLIAPVRTLISGHPRSVIENVPGAPIRKDVILTGGMFGLDILRRRHFELSWWPGLQPPEVPQGRAVTISTHDAWRSGPNVKRAHRYTVAQARTFMGIHTAMTREQNGNAVPPAYAKWIAERA